MKFHSSLLSYHSHYHLRDYLRGDCVMTYLCLSFHGQDMQCPSNISQNCCASQFNSILNSYLKCYNMKTFLLACKGFYCYFIHILCLYAQNIYIDRQMCIHTHTHTCFSSLQRKLRFLQDRSDSTRVRDLLIGKKMCIFVETQALKWAEIIYR